MKMGFTVNRGSIAELEQICDEVVYLSKKRQTPKLFLSFVKENMANQIYMKNIQDMGLQLAQMTPALEELCKHEKAIFFLERGFGSALSDLEFNRLLLEHGQNEKEIMSYRTQAGIKVAQDNGVKYGRPKIKQEIVEQIQYLAKNQGRSVRDIAEICNVSIGTVHKYADKV